MIEPIEETVKAHEEIIHELKENQIRLSMLVERHDKDIESMKSRKTNIFDRVMIGVLTAVCIALLSYILSGGLHL